MNRGYAGKILWVDLTNKTFKSEKIDDKVYEDFLGGYGLAAKIIFDRQPIGLDPLDPQNIMAVMSGLLTNGRAAFNGRWMIAGKSPLTGTWGDSNCGGNFAPAIKDAGFDGLFFIGKSEKPVYLLIDHDTRSLEDAAKLWGIKDAVETEKSLQRKHGTDFKVASIGAGGENLSLIAGVVNDGGRLAGRNGFGALMGSKNLKAVCLRGKHEFPAHNPDRVWEATTHLLKGLVTDLNDFGQTMKNCGTAGTLTSSSESGDAPVKNWQGVGKKDFPAPKANKINAFEVTRYETKKYACYACPFGCGGMCKIPHLNLEETHRPEYETLCGFGTQLLNDDLDSIFMVNDMCNRAGIDTISCATTIDWAFEAYEKQKITQETTGGLALEWSNSKVVIELVRQITGNEGFGAKLKDGLKMALKNLGLEDFAFSAMQVQGQELPMHDSRLEDGGMSLGLGYETEPTPGRHTSTFAGIDAYIEKEGIWELNDSTAIPKFKSKYKLPLDIPLEKIGIRQKNASCAEDIINALGLCNFGFYFGTNPPFLEWANNTTGWARDLDGYITIGQRIKTVRHAFNIREGIDVANIKMPDRARGVPVLKKGPNAYSSNALKWDDAKKAYYEAMGWDPDTAKPLESTLDALDLPDVKKALYK